LATHDLSILHFFFDKASVLKNTIKHDILKKKNFDISFLNLEIDKTKVDINVSWLNPEKIRKIIIIGSKKMLVFDEMNIQKPIQIYDNYVSFPKIDKFSKNFFNQSKYIYKGKSQSIRFKEKKPLNEEIKHFLKSNKIITDIDFSEKIIKTISKL
jgi:predicted dehydrogenase